MELRTGNFGTPTATASADIVAHLSLEMLFDALAIQVDGPKAWDLDLAISIRPNFTELHCQLRSGHAFPRA